ncbi:MAG: hypothetical protein IT365_29565 [Candidatus Hydrogenedentes bacterium]|nr:hypothetical protein [Candidatus Hydrogenedentota bacterium]
MDFIEFSSDDIAHWTTRDSEASREWKKTPVHRARTEDGVRLVGRFEDVRGMDTIATDDPSFWVPLGTLGWTDARLPIDLNRFPIAEVTYRCTSDNALPVLVWMYPGGLHVDSLPTTRQWTTLVRRMPVNGFPDQISDLVFRLFSTTRTTESVEIASVRFRAMTPAEAEACENDRLRLETTAPLKRYDVLDSFMPLGVYLDAETARRNAELLGISLGEYWDLAMEDIVTHHHNCIAMERVGGLTTAEWGDLLAHAETYGIKIAANHDFHLGEDVGELRQLIDNRIRPYANSPAILSWSLREEPPEKDFHNLLKVKEWVEEADPNHPISIVTRHPSAFPLFAPHFPVSGINHFVSHSPWEIGDIVRWHAPLAKGQQFWMVGPAFIYATGTPEWSTCPEMRLMVNLAFANGAKGWFSFAYHNDPIWVTGSCQRTLTGPFMMFSDLWLELDRRMEGIGALAPLLLQTQPAPLPPEWFGAQATSDDNTKLPKGVPTTSSFRLRGPGFNLFFVVSNNVRGMASLNINVSTEALRGNQVVDLSDFVRKRSWSPMDLQRHIEMFPGQAQMVLVGEPDVCARWRDIVAERLIEDDHRQLSFNLKLAQTYSLDIGTIEDLLRRAEEGHAMQKLAIMDMVRDELVNLMYRSPAIRDTRTKIIEACAGICACDGVLCRIITRGKVDLAKEWGLKVIPLAREVTHLRLELRRGRGAEALPYANDVAQRTLALLHELRAFS